MKLQPLRQFICDKCGEIIEKPEDGTVEWLTERQTTDVEKPYSLSYGFKIIHHNYSRDPEDGCSHYNGRQADDSLSNFLGTNSISSLLRFLDVGPHLQMDYKGPEIKDLREFIHLMRRLAIPHYEEALLYWSEASEAGDLEGANESLIYSPDFLKGIVERYAPKE